MLKIVRKTLVLALCSTALVALPATLPMSTGLLSSAAFAAPGGNGNGNGNSGGNGGGNGNSGGNASKSSSSSSHGNSGNSRSSRDSDDGFSAGGGNWAAEGGPPPSSRKKTEKTKSTLSTNSKSATKTEKKQTVAKAAPTPKPRNFNAQLGGLNSLKRNINGLMNSSDPRMDGIRDILLASANIEGAEEALTAQLEKLTTAEGAYKSLLEGFTFTPFDADETAYSEITLESLQTRLETLNGLEEPEDTLEAEALAEEIQALTQAIEQISTSTELADLTKAKEDVKLATDTLEGAQAATGDEALTEALLTAANDNRVGPEYVTAEMLAWARTQLGLEAPAPIEPAPAPTNP